MEDKQSLSILEIESKYFTLHESSVFTLGLGAENRRTKIIHNELKTKGGLGGLKKN